MFTPKKVILIAWIFLATSTWAKTPRWVNNPADYCKKKELCAVGEGVTQTRAKSAARLALGKIFKTQVKSKYSEKVTSVDSGPTNEFLSDELEETTDVLLEGVVIKKVHETDVGFYALASLDKRKLARKIKKEIDAVDKKMTNFAASKRPSQWMKLEPLFNEREALNARYLFLSGFDITSPLNYSEIFKLKTQAAQRMKVHVSLNEDGQKEIEALLVQILSDRGYKTLSGKGQLKKSTHQVSGEYSSQKQYLKVEGFEKYKFILDLRAKNSKKVESGSITTTVVTTGRSFEQAREKALLQVKDYLIENIEKLNIE